VAPSGERSKPALERRRLVDERHSTVLEPAVVDGPRFALRHDLVAHHGVSSQEPQQPELCVSAEAEADAVRQLAEPVTRDGVMHVSRMRERHPDVDVRENK
jgi:hypothetical protein